MGSVSLSELNNLTADEPQAADYSGGKGIALSDIPKTGQSDVVEYAPPPPKMSALDRLAGAADRGIVAEAKQVIPQAMVYMGSFFRKDKMALDLEQRASEADNPNVLKSVQATNAINFPLDNIATRLVKWGLTAQENVKAEMDKKYPDAPPDMLDKVLGFVPAAAEGVALGAFLGAPTAMRLMAAQIGLQSATQGYSNLIEQGREPSQAHDYAAAMGVANGGAAMLGFGLVKTEAGSMVKQVAGHVLNTFSGLFAQGVTSGAMDLVTGITPYNGLEDLKNKASDAATDAAIGALLFSPMGMHAAIKQHNAIRDAFVEAGMPKAKAEEATNEMMKQATHQVMDYLDQKIQATSEQKLRILSMRPDALGQLKQRLDGNMLTPLDQNFLPTEPKSLPETAPLNDQVARLRDIKTEIEDLKKVLAGNTEHQGVNAKIVEQGKIAEDEVNTKHDQILSEKEQEMNTQKETLLATQEKEIQALTKTRDKATSVLEDTKSKTDDVQTKIKQEDAHLYKNKATSSPKFEKLNKQLSDLQNKANGAQKNLTDTEVALKQKATEHSSAAKDLAKAHEDQKTTLEKQRQKELEDRLQNVPILHEAKVNLEKLQDEAKTIRERIASKKGELETNRPTKLQALEKEISRLEQGFRKGKSATKEEVRDVQKQLSDLLKDKEDGLLDKEDRVKFDALMRQTLTSEKLQANMPEIKNKIRQLNQAVERRAWVKDINDINLKALPVDYQDQLKSIMDSFDFKKRTKNELISRARTIDFFRQKLGEGNPVGTDGRPVLTYGEQQALDIASKKSLSEMTHDELRQVHDMIMQVANQGKWVGKLRSNLQARELEAYIGKVLKFLKTPEAQVQIDTLRESAIRDNKGFIKSKADWFDWLNKSHLMPETMLRWSGMEDLFQEFHEAYQRSDEFKRKDIRAFFKLFTNLDVTEAVGKRVPMELLVNGEIKKYVGKESLTLNKMMKVYAQSLNEKGLKHLTGSGLSPKTIEQMNAWVEANHPEATKGVREVMDYFAPGSEAYKRLDDAVVKFKGAHMVSEPNYDPIRQLIDVPRGDVEWGMKGAYGRAVPGSGFTRARVESDLAFKNFDYFGDWARHIADRNHFIEMSDVIQDANKIFADPRVNRALTEKFGEKWVPMIQKFIQDAAFNGHYLDDPVSQAWARARATFTASKILANFGSALKIISQYPVAAHYVGEHWVNKAVLQYMLDADKANKFIDENSLLMKNRPFTQEAAYIEMMKTRDQGVIKRDSKLFQFGMAPHQEVDKIVSRTTWLGAYNKEMASSGDHSQAIIEADRAVRNTHPVGGDIYLPDLFRSGEVGRTIGMFHNAVNKNLNLWAESLHGLEDKTFLEKLQKSPELMSAALARILIPGMLIGMIDLKRGFQKDEFPAFMLDQSVGSNALWGIFTHSYVWGEFKAGNNPATQSLNDVWDTVFKGTLQGKFKAGANTFGDITGIPIENLRRIFTGSMFFQQAPPRRKVKG